MPCSRKPHRWVPSLSSSPCISSACGSSVSLVPVFTCSRTIKKFYCIFVFQWYLNSSSKIAKETCCLLQTKSLSRGFLSTDLCWVAFALKLLRFQLWRPQIYSFAADVLLMPLIWKLEMQWNGCGHCVWYLEESFEFLNECLIASLTFFHHLRCIPNYYANCVEVG